MCVEGPSNKNESCSLLSRRGELFQVSFGRLLECWLIALSSTTEKFSKFVQQWTEVYLEPMYAAIR